MDFLVWCNEVLLLGTDENICASFRCCTFNLINSVKKVGVWGDRGGGYFHKALKQRRVLLSAFDLILLILHVSI